MMLMALVGGDMCRKLGPSAAGTKCALGFTMDVETLRRRGQAAASAMFMRETGPPVVGDLVIRVPGVALVGRLLGVSPIVIEDGSPPPSRMCSKQVFQAAQEGEAAP